MAKRSASQQSGRQHEPPRINETHYLAHAVEIDPDTEMVKGTADAFEIVRQAEQPPVIDEYTLNSRCADKVRQAYPLHRQLNILGDLLEMLVTELQLSGPTVETFRAMRAPEPGAQRALQKGV